MNYELYQLNNEYRVFMDAVERGDIPEDAIADTLEVLNGEFETAADNIATIIKTLRLLADGEREEERRLSERRRAHERQIERYIEYLTAQMQARGCKPVKTPRNTISVRKSTAVEIQDNAVFIAWAQKYGQDDLLTYKAPEPNKTAIKKALNMGAEIDGVRMVDRLNLQVR